MRSKISELRYNNKEIYQGLKDLISDIKGHRIPRAQAVLKLAYSMECMVILQEKLLERLQELEDKLNEGEL